MSFFAEPGARTKTLLEIATEYELEKQGKTKKDENTEHNGENRKKKDIKTDESAGKNQTSDNDEEEEREEYTFKERFHQFVSNLTKWREQR